MSMIVFYSIYVVNFQRNENVLDSQDVAFEEVAIFATILIHDRPAGRIVISSCLTMLNPSGRAPLQKHIPVALRK
jgi:hypothetical protein